MSPSFSVWLGEKYPKKLQSVLLTPGKESNRTMWSHGTRGRSPPLPSEMQHLPQRRRKVYGLPGPGILLQIKRGPVWWHSKDTCHLGCCSQSYSHSEGASCFLLGLQGKIGQGLEILHLA